VLGHVFSWKHGDESCEQEACQLLPILPESTLRLVNSTRCRARAPSLVRARGIVAGRLDPRWSRAPHRLPEGGTGAQGLQPPGGLPGDEVSSPGGRRRRCGRPARGAEGDGTAAAAGRRR
jgi:hypothetical protein